MTKYTKILLGCLTHFLLAMLTHFNSNALSYLFIHFILISPLSSQVPSEVHSLSFRPPFFPHFTTPTLHSSVKTLDFQIQGFVFLTCYGYGYGSGSGTELPPLLISLFSSFLGGYFFPYYHFIFYFYLSIYIISRNKGAI